MRHVTSLIDLCEILLTVGGLDRVSLASLIVFAEPIVETSAEPY